MHLNVGASLLAMALVRSLHISTLARHIRPKIRHQKQSFSFLPLALVVFRQPNQQLRRRQRLQIA